jgi:hypothetical protein
MCVQSAKKHPLPIIVHGCEPIHANGPHDLTAARQDVRVTRLVMWWIGLAASAVMVIAALVNESGTCVDSADTAASTCRSGGSGGLLLLGLAALALSVWMLRRTYRTRRLSEPQR